MDACQNCVMMNAMAGNQLGDQTEMHLLAFQLQCLMKVQALVFKRILQWFLH